MAKKRKKSRKPKIVKEVAFRTGMKAKEELPYPIVSYPNFYGAFFAFSETRDSEVFLCDCTKLAIRNYVFLEKSYRDYLCQRYEDWEIIDNVFYYIFTATSPFPKVIQDYYKSKDLYSTDIEDMLLSLKFLENLCHECNRALPSYSYCVQMYGGVFKRNYGWYINKQSYEFGLKLSGWWAKFNIPECCPSEISELITDEYITSIESSHELLKTDFPKAQELHKKISKIDRKIQNVIENAVREKFGYPLVGEKWISETILFYLVKEFYPNYTINRHYHPDFLEGLELDIYIKDLNLGIEYQGIQHYRSVKHWGGEEALEQLKKRDKRKKVMCDKEGVKLIYFYHDDDLTKTLIKQRISEALKD